MKKKKLVTLLGAISLVFCFSGGEFSNNNQVKVVQAATKQKITLKHNAYQYSAKGKRLKKKKTLKKGHTYTAIGTKKIAGKKYYRLSNKSYIKASNVASKAKKYSKNTLRLTYSLAQVRRGLDDPESLANKSLQGMKKNKFHSESKKDDKTKLNLSKLTASQKRELTNYTLRLINQVRQQLDLLKWTSDQRTQALADEIAREYQIHGKTILDSDHYTAGIIRAAQKYGLQIDDNAIENEAGYYGKRYTTMTQAKRDIYWNLKQFLFGGAVSETGPFVEYDHANNLLKDESSTYGFSISVKDDVISTHFIDVSQSTVRHSDKNGGTW